MKLSERSTQPTDAEKERIFRDSDNTEAFCREHGWDVYLTLDPTFFGDRRRQTLILARPGHDLVYCICDGHMTAGEQSSLFVWMEAVKAGLVG